MQFLPAAENQDLLIHFHSPLDWGRDGDRASTLTLMGYALSEGDRVVALQFVSQGAPVAATEVKLPRPDVLEALGRPHAEEACGFHVRFSKFVYLPDSGMEVFAILANPAGEPLRRHVGRLVELPAPRVLPTYEGRVNPLLVTSLGRSGSTVLMALLSRHPEIVVPGSYPFEVRSLAWMLHSLRVQISPADHVRSTHPDAFEQRTPHWAGHNPYWQYDYEVQERGAELTAWLETDYVAAAISFWREQLDRMCAGMLGGAGASTFYAEKTSLSALRPLTFNLFPGAREIFLVRDFRDVFASARRFNRKRNAAGFGRELARDDEEWARSFSGAAQEIHQAWKARPGILVRYEELVTDPEACCTALLRALDLDSSAACVRRMVAETQQRDLTNAGVHMTSNSAAGSVGGWKDELTEEEVRLLEREAGEALDAFGYRV